MKVRISNHDKNIVYYLNCYRIINDIKRKTISFEYNNNYEEYLFNKNIANYDSVIMFIEKAIEKDKMLKFSIIDNQVNYCGSLLI
jgi:hypothetical protein